MKAFAWAARILSLMVAVWSVCGFGGDTLVEMTAQRLHLPYKTAAFLVSVVFAMLGTASMVLPLRRPGAQQER